jgi:hypothetical protein
MTGQTAVPALFMKTFHDRHFLFLGYGLRDWNLRVVLRNLRGILSGAANAAVAKDHEEQEAVTEEMEAAPKSWAIQFRPSDLEKELWNARGVKIYDVDINEFVCCLRERAS